MTSYWWMICGSNTSKSKTFFSPSYGPDLLWFLTSLLFNWYRGCFPGVKWRRFDMEWTTQLHLILTLRLSSSLPALPVRPLYTFLTWTWTNFFTQFVLISNKHRYLIMTQRLESSYSAHVIEVGCDFLRVYLNQWYSDCFCSYHGIPCQ